MNESVTLKAPLYAKTDVIVIGGGPSGVAAAIAAARCGKKVILIEKSAQLGGMGTLANVSIYMIVGNFTGIYREIISEFKPDFLDHPEPHKIKVHFNPFILRHYLNQKLYKEQVEVLYHTDFITTLMTGNQVNGVILNTREGLKKVYAKQIIDCTGNAQVAIESGVETTSGRADDHSVQPMSLMFQMQDTGRKVNAVLPEDCYHYETEADLPQGRRLYWEIKPEGTLLVNMTRVTGNGAKIEDTNFAERETLKQVLSVANYLQRNGFENYILSHIGAQTGVRETYQIKGLYTLNEDDLMLGRQFEDVVAQSNYNIDIHSPKGDGTCDERDIQMYDIPFRCLVPQKVSGLLVAGRAISATHVAMSSARVMPTCYALGQAAGIAAAIAIDMNCPVADIPIDQLQAALKKQGVAFQR